MNVEIKQAYQRISKYIYETPVLTDDYINELLNNATYFKCENFQKVHAFKARGAINAVLKLDRCALNKGVATHSSGNHGQALAWAASLAGAKAYIVMPETAPEIKVESVRRLGGKITFSQPTLADRERVLGQVLEQTGATFIPPYNYLDVIEGQGTCAYEIFKSGVIPDYLLVPVGGGGLLSGTALAAREYSPETQVIGCEPANADDAYRSFRQGEMVPVGEADTIADGLRTSLGDITFGIIKSHVHDIVTVSEQEIIDAWRWITFMLKVVIEPSCAVAVAVLLKNKEKFKRKKVAVILTGGNVDPGKLRLIL